MLAWLPGPVRDRLDGIDWQRVARVGRWLDLIGLLILVYAWLQFARTPWDSDARGYWDAWRRPSLYAVPWLEHGAYVYAPAVAQLWWPIAQLSANIFLAIIAAAQVAALAYLAGPALGALLLYLPWFPLAAYPNPIWGTIRNGNIELIVALAVVVGLRYPAAWAAVLLTKVTPGIGLLWFVVRREWRNLAIALGATAAITAVSFVIAPGLWFDWFRLLADAAGSNTLNKEPVVQLVLPVRLALAAGLTIVAARIDRPWLLPVAATLALPAIQYGGLAVAVGALWFLRHPDAARRPPAPAAEVLRFSPPER